MRRTQLIITTAAVMALCAAPASAVPYEDLRSPDAKDAALEAAAVQQPTQDLRSPDAKDAAREAAGSSYRSSYQPEPAKPVGQDLRSPDARDAGRDPAPVQIPAPTVEVRQVPTSGFDWGDAGIGAAGMLALFSIAAGSALLLTTRRRRRGPQAIAH
jgi:hypothetical protein